MYSKVSFGRLTSFLLKLTTPVFKLKGDHENLETKEYAAKMSN